MDLRDAQWSILEPFFTPKAKLEKRGRPPQDARAVVNGVLWVLRTGAPWHDLPKRYPPYPTCHRWVSAMATGRDLGECLAGAGGGFTQAGQGGYQGELHRRLLRGGEKGGSGVGKTKRGKGTKIMAIADCHGLPVGISGASASPHETKLVETTLEQRFTREVPGLRIGDKAYDSDPLDKKLKNKYGTNGWRRTRKIAANRTRRMEDSCAAINGDGKWNDYLPGCTTSVAW
jgi:hypothetical protein